jgi:hypothetical protein
MCARRGAHGATSAQAGKCLGEWFAEGRGVSSGRFRSELTPCPTPDRSRAEGSWRELLRGLLRVSKVERVALLDRGKGRSLAPPALGQETRGFEPVGVAPSLVTSDVPPELNERHSVLADPSPCCPLRGPPADRQGYPSCPSPSGLIHPCSEEHAQRESCTDTAFWRVRERGSARRLDSHPRAYLPAAARGAARSSAAPLETCC